jgi:hypothetical protein
MRRPGDFLVFFGLFVGQEYRLETILIRHIVIGSVSLCLCVSVVKRSPPVEARSTRHHTIHKLGGSTYRLRNSSMSPQFNK